MLSSHGRRLAALTVIGTAIAMPLVIFVLGPNMPPGKATEVASGQVFDNTVLLATMTPFAVFILVYIGYALVAFRAPKGETELSDGAPIRGHFLSQVVWLATTTVAVIFLAIFGTVELVVDHGAGGGGGPKPAWKPGGSAPMPVQVIGQQWEFTYRYPTYGGVETAQLMLPAGQPVVFHVTSLDVVHSFWAYELGIKADANPGVDNIAYVTPRKIGTFHIRCAELCGLWHGYMFDTGHVVAPSTFTAWIAARKKQFTPVSKYLPDYSETYSPDPQYRAG